MKTAIHLTAFFALLIAALTARAQPVVAPTPDKPDEIGTAAGYTISNSFEAGYRLSDVAGNRDVYRSQVNFGNGIRLFEGQLRVNSAEGKGGLFDEFSFHTTGQGQDPYQSTTLRVEKNSLYRYDMQFRIVNYFNRLPSLWQGEHGLNSERIFQTHELTLFPNRRFEVILGYDRNNHNGPGFSSENTLSNRGAFDQTNILRFTTNLRQLNNQYRVGVNVRAIGMVLSFLQGFDNYREDTIYGDGSGFPTAVSNVQPVGSLQRTEPIHGNTPYTTVVIRPENEHALTFNGRYTYSGGNRNGFLGENITAIDPANALSTVRQTYVVGQADRRQGYGDLTIGFMPTPKLTFTNTTSINNTRIDGNSTFVEVSLFTDQQLSFEHLGIRYISNITEANFRPAKKIGLYGAFRHSDRRLRTDETVQFPDGEFKAGLFDSKNKINSGVVGLRLLPVSGLRFSVDAEAGRADQPLTPISDRRFHTESARLQWRKKNFLVSGNFQSSINRNPISLIDHSSKSRQFGVQGSWTGTSGKFTLDGGYTILNLESMSGIRNFFDADPTAPAMNFYTSNLNIVNFGTRIQPHARVTLYFGYNLAKDTGDGRGQLTYANGVTRNYPNFATEGSNFYNSYPLSYQSPLARVSLLIHQNISWNLGWQFYNYSEEFTAAQNYHAHVGYTSLRWSF